MKVIYKYRLYAGSYDLTLPMDAQIVDVGTQDGELHLWALVEQSPASFVTREFVTFGTGHPITESGLVYVGTCHGVAGNLVFHVFERVLTDRIAR